MFSLRIDHVKSGMTLAKSVYDLNGTKLLEKDHVLSHKIINTLKNSGAKRLWVTDADNTFLKELGPQKLFQEAVSELKKIKASITNAVSFDLHTVNEIAYELTEQIIINELPYAEMIRMKSAVSTVFEHMVEVAILSVVTAKALGMDKTDMRFLGFGAMVHDIGKFLIPDDILAKPANLNNAEMKLVRKHPQIGFDILKNAEGVNKHVLTVALQHHERIDGSGYPGKLRENQIHTYSRIVAIADIYTAVIREKSYRPRLPIYEAGEMIWAQAGLTLDLNLTSTFLRHAVAFPVRSTVKLNDGSIGQVVYQNVDFPTRPIISIDGNIVDLSESVTLFVSEVLAYEFD